jgi:hypothetical protein
MEVRLQAFIFNGIFYRLYVMQNLMDHATSTNHLQNIAGELDK